MNDEGDVGSLTYLRTLRAADSSQLFNGVGHRLIHRLPRGDHTVLGVLVEDRCLVRVYEGLLV